MFLTGGDKGYHARGDVNLQCWDIDKLFSDSSPSDSTSGPVSKIPKPPAGDADNPAFRLWGPVRAAFTAVIVANQTAISVWTPLEKKQGTESENRKGQWKLSAQNLRDGTSLWEIELPSQPARDGLCINRNGRLVVCFDDGSLRCYGL